MRITAISDTHTKHGQLTKDLPGGDLLLCSGDISSMGYLEEIRNFCKWAASQDYEQVVFIAGNHDWGFQDQHLKAIEIADDLGIIYLQDDLYMFDFHGDILNNGIYDPEQTVKIWGTPWQPEFCDWAFNLPRNSQELELVWDEIPPDTDILLTHGPPYGVMDLTAYSNIHVGCELLAERVNKIKPKIHIFGHIHEGYGYLFRDGTHYINASVLNARYKYNHLPLTFDWDKKTNEIKGFINDQTTRSIWVH